VAEVEAILARHEADFRLLEEASLRPACRFPVNWEAGFEALFPHLAAVRNATRFLVAKALVDAQRGRAGEALDDLAVPIRMSNHISAEPTLIAQLVRIACVAIVSKALPDVLAAAPPTTAESRRLYDLLSEVDMIGPWVPAWKGERASGLGVFDTLRQARSADIAKMIGTRSPLVNPTQERMRVVALSALAGVMRVPWGPFLKLDEVYYVRHMRDVIALGKEPYRNSLADYQKLSEEMDERAPRYAVITRRLAPAFTRAQGGRDGAIARVGMMQAALALRAYQIEHEAYPDSLAELRAVNGWPIPDDPFSGKPFIYRREGEGYLIYSVGPDFADDGGINREAAARMYDLSFRMTR